MRSIWNFFIKNRTVYDGNIFLEFHKFPNYTGHSKGGRNELNSTLINLGFTKLTSRVNIKYECSTNGYKLLTEFKYSKEEQFIPKLRKDVVSKINKYTGGKLEDHYIDGREDCLLVNSFVDSKGNWVGDTETGLWYLNNQFKISSRYSRIAMKIKKEHYFNNNIINKEIIGYHGYNHRGGQLFKIGDYLFDENFKPSVEDFKRPHYKKIIKKTIKQIKKNKNYYNESFLNLVNNKTPFTLRGDVKIENLDQAEQAALNFVRYLS